MSIKAIQSKRSVKSQRGYSLIELSIAMAILSVVIVGSLVGVQRILANNRTNNVLQFVPRMNASLISGTLGGGTATVINTNLAARLGSFDPNTVSGSGATQSVRNEFGGTYSLISNKAVVGSSAASGGYFIYITNVPKSVCPVLANGLSSMTDGMWVGAATALVAPAANKADAGDTPTTGLVETPGGLFSVADAATQCDANTSSTVVAFIPMT